MFLVKNRFPYTFSTLGTLGHWDIGTLGLGTAGDIYRGWILTPLMKNNIHLTN